MYIHIYRERGEGLDGEASSSTGSVMPCDLRTDVGSVSRMPAAHSLSLSLSLYIYILLYIYIIIYIYFIMYMYSEREWGACGRAPGWRGLLFDRERDALRLEDGRGVCEAHAGGPLGFADHAVLVLKVVIGQHTELDGHLWSA